MTPIALSIADMNVH